MKLPLPLDNRYCTGCQIEVRPFPMVRRFYFPRASRGLHREWGDHIKGQIGWLALSFSEIRRRRQHGELYDADGTGGHVSSLHGRPLVGAPGKKHCAWYLQRLHDSAYLWRKFTHLKLLICEQLGSETWLRESHLLIHLVLCLPLHISWNRVRME